MTQSTNFLRFALEGERVRRAASTLEQVSPQLATALRRAIPFLAARGTTVAASFARAIPVADLIGDLARPLHATHLALSPGGARGAIVLDGVAVSTILDGVLGGDGSAPPQLDPAGLTSPQVALLSRVVDGVVRALSEVLSRHLSLSIQVRPPDADDAIAEGAPIACSLELACGERPGHVVLLLAKEALLASEEAQEHPAHAPDKRVAAVVEQVEVEVVAELARMKMTLAQLGALNVGDIIRLDVPVNATVSVRADGHVLLRGHPTTSAGQIAIRIARGTGHGD